MNEGHRPVGALARLAVDQLGLRGGQRLERRRKVIGHEADVMDALAPLVEEPGDTALGVDRLDELDPRGGLRAGGQEAETHALAAKTDGSSSGAEAEELAVASERRLDRAHDDRDVMDRPDPRPSRHGRCSPHTRRMALAISPSVTVSLDAGTDPRQHVLGPGRGAVRGRRRRRRPPPRIPPAARRARVRSTCGRLERRIDALRLRRALHALLGDRR